MPLGRRRDTMMTSCSNSTQCFASAHEQGYRLPFSVRYIYVELATRISIVELQPEEGLLREALGSLYSLFGTTREILRKYGPTVGKPKGEGRLSFGLLAVAVLNIVLRPVLSKWHPVLEDYESTKPAGMSPSEHERR